MSFEAFEPDLALNIPVLRIIFSRFKNHTGYNISQLYLSTS